MPAPVTLREETPADVPGIDAVNRLAFGGEAEARIVARLREEEMVILSLVAVTDDGQVVGHLMFSRLPVETENGPLPAAAMAPLAVRPALQGQGIGTALVRQGLDMCRERGCAAVIVLGEPPYYTRFGFSAKLTAGLTAPFAGEAFMGFELTPGALQGVKGTVTYPRLFFEEG